MKRFIDIDFKDLEIMALATYCGTINTDSSICNQSEDDNNHKLPSSDDKEFGNFSTTFPPQMR